MLLRRCLLKRRCTIYRHLSSSVDVKSPVENRTAEPTVKHYNNTISRSPACSDIEDILNKKKQVSVNDCQKSGVFGLSVTNLESYYVAVTGRCDELLAQLEGCEVEETLEIVDDVVRHVVMLSALASFLSQSLSNKRHEARTVLQKAEVYINALNTNKCISTALKLLVLDTDHWEQLDTEARRAVVMLLLDSKKSGVDLPAQKQEEIQTLNTEIRDAGIDFLRGSIKPTKISLEECPDALLSLPCENDNIVLSDWCDDVPNDSIREAAWLHYNVHNAKQEASLHKLLDKRHKLAAATGYANYAEYTLQGTMAGSSIAVKEFLTELHTQLRPIAKDEIYEFEKWKVEGSKHWYNRGQNKLNDLVVYPWDTPFYRDEMQALWIKEGLGKMKPYPSLPDFLSVGTVVEQIGVWLEDTFAVTLVAERPLDGELWSPDVIKLAVEHEKEGLLGFLYLDFYDSERKRASPRHHLIRAGTQKQIPISVIECNYTASNGYRPPHLNIKTLNKLFQELGAAVHTMLSSTKYYQTSSSFLSPDTRLISSYLMKNIAQHPAVLNHVMKHHTRTRIFPRIDPSTVTVYCNAQQLMHGQEVEQQLLYSALDQTLHTEWPFSGGKSSTDILAEHTEQYTHLPYVEGSAPHLRFNPLFTQGGHVYSHLWCRGIATILYEELFVVDPFSRHAGEYFREHFLKHAAGRKPREMVEYLTGSTLTAERLAAAICRPIELSQNIGTGYDSKPNVPTTARWHRQVSSPDSALFSRLSHTHPHLASPDGKIKVPPKFSRTNIEQISGTRSLPD